MFDELCASVRDLYFIVTQQVQIAASLEAKVGKLMGEIDGFKLTISGLHEKHRLAVARLQEKIQKADGMYANVSLQLKQALRMQQEVRQTPFVGCRV